MRVIRRVCRGSPAKSEIPGSAPSLAGRGAVEGGGRRGAVAGPPVLDASPLKTVC